MTTIKQYMRHDYKREEKTLHGQKIEKGYATKWAWKDYINTFKSLQISIVFRTLLFEYLIERTYRLNSIYQIICHTFSLVTCLHPSNNEVPWRNGQWRHCIISRGLLRGVAKYHLTIGVINPGNSLEKIHVQVYRPIEWRVSFVGQHVNRVITLHDFTTAFPAQRSLPKR